MKCYIFSYVLDNCLYVAQVTNSLYAITVKYFIPNHHDLPAIWSLTWLPAILKLMWLRIKNNFFLRDKKVNFNCQLIITSLKRKSTLIDLPMKIWNVLLFGIPIGCELFSMKISGKNPEVGEEKSKRRGREEGEIGNLRASPKAFIKRTPSRPCLDCRFLFKYPSQSSIPVGNRY